MNNNYKERKDITVSQFFTLKRNGVIDKSIDDVIEEFKEEELQNSKF